LNKLAENNISWREWLTLKIADKNANRKNDGVSKEYIRKICTKIQKASKITGKSINVIDLAVSGHDVMEAFNLRPGPEVGNILKMLLEAVIDTPSMNEKEQLLNFAREHVDC
jgi:tRNA nucleotidyltransferase/poly(A) polymerase